MISVGVLDGLACAHDLGLAPGGLGQVGRAAPLEASGCRRNQGEPEQCGRDHVERDPSMLSLYSRCTCFVGSEPITIYGGSP